MKKLFLSALIALFAMLSVKASSIAYQCSPNGLACDLIQFRVKIAAFTGVPVPGSAFQECKLMGFLKHDTSLVSHLGDKLKYENGMIVYQRDSTIVALDLASNTVTRQHAENLTYAVFVPGVGCCDCESPRAQAALHSRILSAAYDDAQEDMYASYVSSAPARMHAPKQIRPVPDSAQKAFNKLSGEPMHLSVLLNHDDVSFTGHFGKIEYTGTLESTASGKKITIVHAKDKFELTVENGQYVLKRPAHNEVLFRYPRQSIYILKSTKERLRFANHALAQLQS